MKKNNLSEAISIDNKIDVVNNCDGTTRAYRSLGVSNKPLISLSPDVLNQIKKYLWKLYKVKRVEEYPKLIFVLITDMVITYPLNFDGEIINVSKEINVVTERRIFL